MKKITLLLGIITVSLMAQGCIVIINENGSDEVSEEDQCLDTFEDTSYSWVYDAETDCGDGGQGAIELRYIYYEEAPESGYDVRGKVGTFSGDDFLRHGAFYSTCEATNSLWRLDIRMGQGENDSEHAMYRCDYDIAGIGKAQPCYLTLSDGKRIESQPACTVSLFEPVKQDPYTRDDDDRHDRKHRH